MTPDDRVAALVAWWVTVYTRRLPPDVAETPDPSQSGATPHAEPSGTALIAAKLSV